MPKRIVVAMTGASGATYGLRLVEVLTTAGCEVHLSISPAAGQVIAQELVATLDLTADDTTALWPSLPPSAVRYHRFDDLLAPIASGSFLTDGMVVCPCSGGTLAAIVHGLSMNLIHRAAEVHLKERRPLVLVPRETPLSKGHLENLVRATDLGATVLPAAPGFYHRPQTIAQLVDFIVARICDQLHVEHNLTQRWGEDEFHSPGTQIHQ